VSLSGAVTSIVYTNNDDGTVNAVYPFKAIKVEILDELGKVVKLKDTRSRSQQLRGLILKKYRGDNTIQESDEAYYDSIMLKIMDNLDTIVNL
jgi:hypothetical protein